MLKLLNIRCNQLIKAAHVLTCTQTQPPQSIRHVPRSTVAQILLDSACITQCTLSALRLKVLIPSTMYFLTV